VCLRCLKRVISGQTAPAQNPTNVRYGPKADKLLRRSDCPLCANSEQTHRNMIGTKRKTANCSSLSEIRSGELIRLQAQLSASCPTRALLGADHDQRPGGSIGVEAAVDGLVGEEVRRRALGAAIGANRNLIVATRHLTLFATGAGLAQQSELRRGTSGSRRTLQSRWTGWAGWTLRARLSRGARIALRPLRAGLRLATAR